jgi:hypothetical protein
MKKKNDITFDFRSVEPPAALPGPDAEPAEPHPVAGLVDDVDLVKIFNAGLVTI